MRHDVQFTNATATSQLLILEELTNDSRKNKMLLVLLSTTHQSYDFTEMKKNKFSEYRTEDKVHNKK